MPSVKVIKSSARMLSVSPVVVFTTTAGSGVVGVVAVVVVVVVVAAAVGTTSGIVVSVEIEISCWFALKLGFWAHAQSMRLKTN